MTGFQGAPLIPTVQTVRTDQRFARGTALAAFAWVMLACGAPEPPVTSVSFPSEVYPVDRIYRSMMGPMGSRAVHLGDPEVPELVWITGYRTEIVGSESELPLSSEFMCHSNLGLLRPKAYAETFGWQRPAKPRLFTLSQGQMDVRFPEGFGIPIVSTEGLRLDTQVLNLNPQDEAFAVRHRTTIDFVRDRDLEGEMRPLAQHAAQGMVLVDGEDGYFAIPEPDAAVHGESCAIGAPAGKRTIRDPQGREFAAHWVVPPGRHVYRTNVTGWMDVPFDTTVHHIAVHVHPFAESIELRDLTTGEIVFTSRATNTPGRIGLLDVESLSSVEGRPVYRDHQYQLISIYDNTSDEPQDAMAVMFLYLLDRQFSKPDSDRLRAATQRAAGRS